MGDWKKHKGAGKWAFEKSSVKPRYNVGSDIKTSEEPVWDMYDFTGEPVTPGHDPCGYWHDHPEFSLPFEFVETVTGIKGWSVAWGDIETSQGMGRFIKTQQYSYNVQYSDDGGFTWKTGLTFSGSVNTNCLTFFCNGFFFVSVNPDFYYSKDGITWTFFDVSTLYSGTYTAAIVNSVSYNPRIGLFVFGSAIGSSTSSWGAYFYASEDLESFFHLGFNARLSSYAVYYGNGYINNRSFLGAYNYNNLRYSSGLSTLSNDWVGITSPGSTTQKIFMAESSSVLVWSNWYTENGSTWSLCYNKDSKTYSGAGSRVDYNSISKFISYKTLTLNGVSRKCIISSLDGKIWEAPFYYTESLQLDGIAIGSHGYVAVGYYGSIVGLKRDIPIVYYHKFDGNKRKWKKYKDQVPWKL